MWFGGLEARNRAWDRPNYNLSTPIKDYMKPLNQTENRQPETVPTEPSETSGTTEPSEPNRRWFHVVCSQVDLGKARLGGPPYLPRASPTNSIFPLATSPVPPPTSPCPPLPPPCPPYLPLPPPRLPLVPLGPPRSL